MTPDAGRFVPKVHPASRPAEPEDPLVMEAFCVAGDPELMLRCLVGEYAALGWDAEQILGLFEDPDYTALCELRQRFGPAGLRARVADLLGPARAVAFQVAVWEAPEVEPERELLQLGIRTPWHEGDDHA
jgi:hypothetical protein